MTEKKTMKVWQLIILLVLCVAIFITMFLPAFRIDGSVVGRMTRDVIESIGLDGFGIAGDAMDEKIAEIEKETDEKFKKIEQENHVQFTKISPWAIMRKDFTRFMFGDIPDKEELEMLQEDEIFRQIQQAYNLIKIFLWIVYGLALVILLLTLLGFFLKWKKFIVLVISCIYGVIAAAFFGYLRFGLMGYIAGKAGDAIMDSQLGDVFNMAGDSLSVSKVLSYFHSLAFLIAFIIAVAIVVASVLSMFLGKNTAYVPQGDWNDGPLDMGNGDGFPGFSDGGMQGGFGMDMQGGFGVDMQGAFGGNKGPFGNDNTISGNGFPGVDTKAQTESYNLDGDSHQKISPSPLQDPVKQVSPMGQVRCIKGVATGQGFMLPEDRKVIVGKSPSKANLVINDEHVSNIHCSIRYHAATNTYLVKDHSSNGTYVNGVRLQNNLAIEFPSGTVLSFADGKNELILG